MDAHTLYNTHKNSPSVLSNANTFISCTQTHIHTLCTINSELSHKHTPKYAYANQMLYRDIKKEMWEQRAMYPDSGKRSGQRTGEERVN